MRPVDPDHRHAEFGRRRCRAAVEASSRRCRAPRSRGVAGRLRRRHPGRDLNDAIPLANRHRRRASRDHDGRSRCAGRGKIRNAGAIFIGGHTPEAIGDYVGGSNHVLPTARSARFSSGLGVLDFMKRTSILKCGPDQLRTLGPAAMTLGKAEGLDAHARSVGSASICDEVMRWPPGD
jgi:hypothetical protein